jgi:mono/diheme cytochrome c family protein
MKRVLIYLGFLLVVLLAGLGYVTSLWIKRGFSARDKPSALEASLANWFRVQSIPERYRRLINPVPATEEVYRQGMDHFADHCAICHGNDGNGDTPLGKNLYPPAPVLKDTKLSSGELYYTIQNGIRLSGMPAFGEPDKLDDETTWMLVNFIQHLRMQSDEDLQRMRQLNPQTPSEQQREQETKDFLNSNEVEMP